MENRSLTITKSGQTAPGSLASGTPPELVKVLRTNHCHCSRRAAAAPKATHANTLPEIRPDPLQFAITQLGFQPNAPQTAMLVNPYPNLIVNKSTVTAIRALHLALTTPESLIIVAGRTSRQSGEFVMKVEAMLRRLGIRATGGGTNDESLQFPNGSRLIGIPGTFDGNVRGFSGTNFLIIDEDEIQAGRQSALYPRPPRNQMPESKFVMQIPSCICGAAGVCSNHRGTRETNGPTGNHQTPRYYSRGSPGTCSDYYRGQCSRPRLNGPIGRFTKATGGVINPAQWPFSFVWPGTTGLRDKTNPIRFRG